MPRKKRSIPKPCGIETELGVSHPGMRENANYEFVNDYRSEARIPAKEDIEWDVSDRLDVQDQRDVGEHTFFDDVRWRKVSNILLENGARLYVDIGPHTECSCPTCLDAKMLLIWNRACYRKLDKTRVLLAQRRGRNYRIIRNNIARDAKWHTSDIPEFEVPRDTFASHLNITVSRHVPILTLTRNSIQLFSCLLPIAGAGKVRSDFHSDPADYQISQRADWITEPFSGSTTMHRGIDNQRDNPYGDESLYRRKHIICFDSNMLELPEYLKAGVISLFYKALEDGFIKDLPEFKNPVDVFHAISRDLTVSRAYECANRKRNVCVTDWLKRCCDVLAKYHALYYPADAVSLDVLRRFDAVIRKLAQRDWDGLFGALDWVTKKHLIEESVIRKGKTWKDSLAFMVDYRYHDNDHENGLFFRVAAKSDAIKENRILTAEDEAMLDYAELEAPPTRNRWFPKIILGRFGPHVRMWDWGSITFTHDPARSNEIMRLYFGNPGMEWNEEQANELLSLPLPTFTEMMQKLGIATRARPICIQTDTEYEKLYAHYGMEPPHHENIIARLRAEADDLANDECRNPELHGTGEGDDDSTSGWLMRRMMGETSGLRKLPEEKKPPQRPSDAPVHPNAHEIILDKKAPKPRLVWRPRYGRPFDDYYL